MTIDLTQFRDAFMQESVEHLDSMEANLLQLRSAPSDHELLNAIFRSAHSIKGGAGTFGLTSLVRFTHVLENLLERLRSLEMPATEQVIDILLKSVDTLHGLLNSDQPEEMPEAAAALIQLINELNPVSGTSELALSPATLEISQERRYTVNFVPNSDILASGSNPLLLLRNLAALGTVLSCVLHVDRLPSLEKLDPASSYLHWTVELRTSNTEEAILEVFEFVEHLATISIQENTSLIVLDTDLSKPELIPSSIEVRTAEAASSVSVPQGPKKAVAITEGSSIRVATDKVDRLIDLVGELVIAHVMTEQMVGKFTPECLPQLRAAVAAMEQNTRELHQQVMAIRMLPVGALFQRYTRTVYDIARATGKQIELELEGEETEIDKSMLELLGDPLTHLIRNAADHGIESPEQRLKAGKPEQGRIRLVACHRSGRIAIEITDDGAGVDPARVRQKAIERGLIAADAQLSDQQLKMLIFEPGFSTRDQVSDLSGRGVGMDVVKRNIEQLNGSVAMTSTVGEGSIVTIELPLTLAILEGLLVRVQDRTLVLPLLSVVETVSPGVGQIVRIAEKGEAVLIRGESIPLLRLSRFLGLPGAMQVTALKANERVRDLVVVVESGKRKIGLAVDELMGQQQVVLKSLERHMHKVDGLMGATILGDGCVAPIVDITGIANLDLFSLSPSTALPLASSLLSTTLHGQANQTRAA